MRNAFSRKGFTLIELLVVVLIVGILAAMGLTQYGKTVESAKADQAAALTLSIAAAHRMLYLEKSLYLDGNLSSCDPAAAPSADCKSNVCDLMVCGFLAKQDLNNKPYIYKIGTTSCGAGLVACASRRVGADPGTDALPYSGWGYTVSNAGVAAAVNGAPPPP